MLKRMNVPRWEKYKRFFQITIFRYLVIWFSLVPIVTTLLNGLPQPLPLQIGEQLHYIDLAMPFTWQILWLSSLLYLAALIIYAIRCPSFIAQYNDYSEYSAKGHDGRWLAWEAKELAGHKADMDKFVSRLRTKKFVEEMPVDCDWSEDSNPLVEEHVTSFSFEAEGKKWKLSAPVMVDNKPQEKGLFWEIYGRYTESRSVARFFIYLLLIGSLVLFLIAFSQHVVSGGESVFEWIQSFRHSTDT